MGAVTASTVELLSRCVFFFRNDDGNLFITGRMKEVIVLSNGKNIYPEEIEAHYLKSAFIKEIAVMGLEGPPGDPTAERLHAVVVPNFDVLKERKVVNSKEVKIGRAHV